MKNVSNIDYIFLISLSAIWGSSFTLIKFSIDTIPPSLLTFIRLFIASIFLILYIKYKTNFLILEKKYLRKIVVIAVLGNVIPFNLIGWSENHVDSINAAALIGTMPLFTFLISHFLKYGEKLNTRIVIGLFMGFLGMYLLLRNTLNPTASNFNLANLSNFLIVLASICYAFSANFIKDIENLSPIQIATSSTIIATIISLPIFLLTYKFSFIEIQQVLTNISSKSLFSSLFLGFMCNAIAVTIFFKLIQKQSAGFASQSNFFIPCFGILWSFIFLDESLSNIFLFSTTLIILGVIFVHKGRKKFN